MTDLPDAKLQPCPFCGESEDMEMDIHDELSFVHCGGCGTDGPYDHDKSKAVELWNTRHGAAHD